MPTLKGFFHWNQLVIDCIDKQMHTYVLDMQHCHTGWACYSFHVISNFCNSLQMADQDSKWRNTSLLFSESSIKLWTTLTPKTHYLWLWHIRKNDTPEYCPPLVQCYSLHTSHSHLSDLIENPFIFAPYNAFKWLHQEADSCDLAINKVSLSQPAHRNELMKQHH